MGSNTKMKSCLNNSLSESNLLSPINTTESSSLPSPSSTTETHVRKSISFTDAAATNTNNTNDTHTNPNSGSSDNVAERTGKSESYINNTDSSSTNSSPTSNKKAGKKSKNAIFLCANDAIVPTAAVARYLNKKQNDGNDHYEYFVAEGAHGSMLLSPRWLPVISNRIRKNAGLNSVPSS